MADSTFPLISVIVPVYNVEKYLERCVNSIIGQSYKQIEILLVDDGSTDGSGELCDRLSMVDKRIKVIHKTNGGLSDARNYGIDKSTGQYICFIDSDDVISDDYIEHLLDVLLKNDSDISIGMYTTFSENISFEKKEDYSIRTYNGKDALNLLVGPEYVKYTVAWNKLYKRQLFNAIRFPVGKIHEDEATMYRLFYRSNRVTYSNKIIYGYFMRTDSITKSSFTRKRLDYLDVAKDRALFFEKRDPCYFEIFQYVYAMGLLSYSIQVDKYLKDRELAKKLYKEFKPIRIQLLKSGISKKRKIALFLLGANPRVYQFYLRVTGYITNMNGG